MSVSVRPYHIVQIGTDDSAFSLGRDAEFVQRQVAYGKLVEQLRPNSMMTLVVLTQNRNAKPFQISNVTFRPLVVDLRGWSKFRAWYGLYSVLEDLNREQHINVLTTQTVHDESWMALLFAKRRHCAIVGQIHYDIFNPYAKATLAHNLIGKLRYAIAINNLKYFTALRVVGQGIAREILKRNLHSHVHVLPVTMPMLTEEFPFDGKQRESKILFVGRLVEQKNLPLWLQVAELVLQAVPEAYFEIVGDGKLRTDLENLIKQKGLSDKVSVVGAVNYENLAAIYQSASIFLLTSAYEGFGRVVAEALANRVPVVAPQITGVEDIIVNGRSGFLHPSGDVSGMASSVITLLRNPSMVDEMGRWGEKDVKQKFNPQTLTQNWMQLLVDCAR